MNKNEELENKVKAHLDESLDELSPDISRRLQQARYAALEKATVRPRWFLLPQTAAAAIAVAVISIGLSLNFEQAEVNGVALAMGTEMEMLSSKDSLELMEDIEFMEWLIEFEEYTS